MVQNFSRYRVRAQGIGRATFASGWPSKGKGRDLGTSSEDIRE